MKIALVNTCMACLKDNTFTAVTLRGRPEFVAAVLVMVGIEKKEAISFVETRLSSAEPPPRLTNGWHEWRLRLCPDCARRSGMQAVDLSLGEPLSYTEAQLAGA